MTPTRPDNKTMIPTVEYVDFLAEGLVNLYFNLLELPDDPRFRCWAGTDEPYPLELSDALWRMSQRSQRLFETNVLAYGKN